jgi:hypothetical protein
LLVCQFVGLLPPPPETIQSWVKRWNSIREADWAGVCSARRHLATTMPVLNANDLQRNAVRFTEGVICMMYKLLQQNGKWIK